MGDQTNHVWVSFASGAAQMMRTIRDNRSEPLEPLMDFIKDTDSIASEELRIDLQNVLWEMEGAPNDLDAAIRLLEFSRSEQHYISMDNRLDDFASLMRKLRVRRRRCFRRT